MSRCGEHAERASVRVRVRYIGHDVLVNVVDFMCANISRQLSLLGHLPGGMCVAVV